MTPGSSVLPRLLARSEPILILTVPSSSLTRDNFFPYKSSLQPIEPSSCTRHGWFRLASIDQYSSLLPPVGVWSVSQYQCGGSPSQAPYPSSSWCAVTTPPTSEAR